MSWITTATSPHEGDLATSVAVLPVGSFEQHGAHLPLATDTFLACLIAGRVAETYGLRLLPPLTITCSHEHADWPGTVSVSATTLCRTIEDVRNSLGQQGIERLAIVNAHGGNHVLTNVAMQANAESEAVSVVLFPGREEWTTAREYASLASTHSADMHAGEIETSMLLHAAPELVGDYLHADHAADPRPHLAATGMRGYTSTGVVGAPSQATAAKGAAVLDSLDMQFADYLKLLS